VVCGVKLGRRLWAGAAGWVAVASVILIGLVSFPVLAQTGTGSSTVIETPKPMAADADPAFEVATIKLSKPDDNVDGFDSKGRHVTVENYTVNDLIQLAYGLSRKQVVGGPAWLDEDRYDIDGIADVAGEPNTKQMKVMIQKLLADRYQLTIHREKKELSIYAITVGKSGAKLTKSVSDPDAMPDEHGNGGSTGLTVRYTNYSMADLAKDLQTRQDGKPVVDQTGIAGRFDFTLKWWPDRWGIASANAEPVLGTAIQEQLGLKLEAVKAPVDVIMIDHVERPSAN